MRRQAFAAAERCLFARPAVMPQALRAGRFSHNRFFVYSSKCQGGYVYVSRQRRELACSIGVACRSARLPWSHLLVRRLFVFGAPDECGSHHSRANEGLRLDEGTSWPMREVCPHLRPSRQCGRPRQVAGGYLLRSQTRRRGGEESRLWCGNLA